MRIKENLENKDKIAAAIQTEDKLMGVIKVEFQPSTGTITYSVQHCSGDNDTKTGLETLFEPNGKGFKLVEIRKDEDRIRVEFEGVSVVAITFDAVAHEYPGKFLYGGNLIEGK